MDSSRNPSAVNPAACMTMIHQALRRHRALILLRMAGALIGAVITPFLLVAMAGLMMFYVVFWIFIAGSTAAEVHGGLLLLGLLLLLYAVLMTLAWRREMATRRYYYQTIEKRPPAEFCPAGTDQPIYYVRLGTDLMGDDVPPHWLMRIPSLWAGMLVRVWLQWQLYRFVAHADLAAGAALLVLLAGAGGSVSMDKMDGEQWPRPRLHLALCTLLMLDLAAVNADWSKVWLHSSTMQDLTLKTR